jgi:hypothetical protein
MSKTTMPPYNFNPDGHMPYTRVPHIEIAYGDDQIPRISITIAQAIVDGAGQVRHTDRTRITKGPISALSLPATVPAMNEATGEPIPGETVSLANLQKGLYSYVRAIIALESAPAVQAEQPTEQATERPTDGTDGATSAE